MNILLVNTDAVVTKLVRLSTQKTGDRLDVATALSEIRDESYDLLILEHTLFSESFLEALNDKIIYAHSIFITTREKSAVPLFEKTLFKPFLPTELLLMLHLFATSVKKEQDERAKEIVFDAFDDDIFSEDEILSDPALENAVEVSLELPEPEIEEPHIESPVTLVEDEAFASVFAKEDVSEVKAILDALNEEEDILEEVVEELISEPEVDHALEMALSQSLKVETPLDEGHDKVEEKISESVIAHPSQKNQESIETLRTLLQALENPQLSRTLRGSITINLTFGDDQ